MGPGCSRFGDFVGFGDAAYASVTDSASFSSCPFVPKYHLLIIWPFPIADARQGVCRDQGAVGAAHQDAGMEVVGGERKWRSCGAGEADAAVKGS